MHTKKSLLTGVSAALLLSLAAIAQPAPEQAQPMPGQVGARPAGPGGNAPAANAGIDSVKPLIKSTDEEWKVIGPKLQAVVTARQAVVTYTAAGTGGGGFGGFGGGGGFPNFGTDSFAGPAEDGPGFGGRGGRGGPGGPGGGDGRGGFDPAMAAAFAGRGGPGGADGAAGRGGFDPAAFAGRGGPGGGAPGGFGGNNNNNAVGTALAELKTALAEPTTTPEQAKAKLAAVRSARQKAVRDLATAQKNLLPLLTADQEATLVSLGYLD